MKAPRSQEQPEGVCEDTPSMTWRAAEYWPGLKYSEPRSLLDPGGYDVLMYIFAAVIY